MTFDKIGVDEELVAEKIEERGLDAAKAVIEIGDRGDSEMESVGVALLGQTVDDRSAGITEVHDFSSLVDGFARRVVDSLTKDLHVEMAAKEQNLGMSSRDEETDKRKLWHAAVVILLDEMGEHMGLEVVDFQEGDIQSLRKTFGKRDAHHKRA